MPQPRVCSPCTPHTATASPSASAPSTTDEYRQYSFLISQDRGSVCRGGPDNPTPREVLIYVKVSEVNAMMSSDCVTPITRLYANQSGSPYVHDGDLSDYFSFADLYCRTSNKSVSFQLSAGGIVNQSTVTDCPEIRPVHP